MREFESDLPAQSKRRAVETGDAASREEPEDETVSGVGPTKMDVSAVAEAYSRPYNAATPGAELNEQRVLATRFEELEEFKRQGVYAKVPVNEALKRRGRSPSLCDGRTWTQVTYETRSTCRASQNGR